MALLFISLRMVTLIKADCTLIYLDLSSISTGHSSIVLCITYLWNAIFQQCRCHNKRWDYCNKTQCFHWTIISNIPEKARKDLWKCQLLWTAISKIPKRNKQRSVDMTNDKNPVNQLLLRINYFTVRW